MTTTVTLTDMLKQVDTKVGGPLEVIVKKGANFYDGGTTGVIPSFSPAGSEDKPGFKLIGYLGNFDTSGLTLATGVGEDDQRPINETYVPREAIYDIRKVISFK